MKEQIEKLIKKYELIYKELNCIRSEGSNFPYLDARMRMVRGIISDLQNLLKQQQ